MTIPLPVVVVGAGFVGRALVAELARRGIAVVATTRSGRWAGEAGPPGVELRGLDVAEDAMDSMRATLEGAAAIVLCYSSGGTQDRRRLFIDGGRRIVEVCRMLRPARVVYTSSTAALPERDGWLDESCDEWPSDERGRIQREAERVMREGLSAAAIPWIVLRLAGLYGPGRELARLYRLDPGRPLAGDGMRPTNLLHRDDAVAALLAALAQPPATTGLIQVCDDDHRTRREMIAQVAASLGTAPPRWEIDPAPGAPVRGKRVCNAKMKQVLGVSLAHPTHMLQL